MSIKRIKTKHYFIRIRRVMPSGEVKNKTQHVYDTRKVAETVEQDLKKKFEKEIAQTQSSLKLINNVSEVLKYYVDVKEGVISWQAIQAPYDRLMSDIGHYSIAEDFRAKFATYWISLDKVFSKRRPGKKLSASHKNRCLKLLNSALEQVRKHGFIEKNPIYRCFDLHPEEERDRVYTPDEINILLEVMKKNGSYLYWPFKFSLKNPVRKEDLIGLGHFNFDRNRPWVVFRPCKTQRGHGPKKTTLLELDDCLDHLLSVPPDCEWLFYKVLVDGTYAPLGSFSSHFHTMLNLARAERRDDPEFLDDVKWHDTKHNAITWMLDNGYTPFDLKNLGIQFSERLVNLYYHFDAEKVLMRRQKEKQESISESTVMALQNGTAVR